ncbi:MAG: LysM peptidoglycan-binding domain-containing protein [Myxococcota bacterium]
MPIATPLILSLALTTLPGSEGEVKVPVERWDRLETDANPKPPVGPPSVSSAALDRSISGRFRKGLFSGNLTQRFVVLAEGHVRVPVIDGRASLGSVTLDGKRTSLRLDGDMYTVGVDGPGRHELKAEMYWGKEQDRFTRRISFKIPSDGPTHFEVQIPERDIEAKLDSGVLMVTRSEGDGTFLSGNTGRAGLISLAWSRRITHEGQAAMKSEARVHAVLTVRESLVTGLAIFDVHVLEGETDRVELVIPEGLEILRVDGDAVLQWRSEGKGKLTVLLRYLVDAEVSIRVRFQLPVDPDKPLLARIPTADPKLHSTGELGIQAPAGLDVRTVEAKNAEILSARDTPEELSQLSPTPLLSAFRFTDPPEIQLQVSRHQEVELTSTLVDELQASTIVLESGLEITKLKLRIRNNARQYLSMKLPHGAILTHSLIDGIPVRPAAGKEGNEADTLLIPLRQSEKNGRGMRTHTVSPGETLSDIANFYFSDPTAWNVIFSANPDQLADVGSLQTGQVLKIPARAGATVEESAFAVELAYKTPRGGLGALGSRALSLPAIDVDTLAITWHVYLPDDIDPLSFSSNLTQYSAIRYDPFRRAIDILESALSGSSAWASDARYQNILSQRKMIWKAEASKTGDDSTVLSTFPLVGDRYRFKRVLLGQDQPQISVLFMKRGMSSATRWAVLLGSAIGGWWLFGRRRAARELLVLVPIAAAVLVLGHFVLGVHKRVVWGLDLALLLRIGWPWLKLGLARLAALAYAPWKLQDLVRVRTALALLGFAALAELPLRFPVLGSTLLFLGLFAGWLWSTRARAAEVPHV